MSDASFGRRDPKITQRANDNIRIDPALERDTNDFQSDAAAIECPPSGPMRQKRGFS